LQCAKVMIAVVRAVSVRSLCLGERRKRADHDALHWGAGCQRTSVGGQQRRQGRGKEERGHQEPRQWSCGDRLAGLFSSTSWHSHRSKANLESQRGSQGAREVRGRGGKIGEDERNKTRGNQGGRATGKGEDL
jgi:hypothetical protein